MQRLSFYVWLISLSIISSRFIHAVRKGRISFLYIYLVALGSHWCTQNFSSCSEWGLLFIAEDELLIEMASLDSEQGLRVQGLQRCCTGSVVAAHRLSRAASVSVAHRLSCSSACRIFPYQGSSPCPLHQ